MWLTRSVLYFVNTVIFIFVPYSKVLIMFPKYGMIQNRSALQNDMNRQLHVSILECCGTLL